MSQAEDLLNSLSENDISTKTEPHIVVGSNRVITVPSELKRIAVQYDHNIETVTFDCPRYWDDHDMSTMKVYINYTRADNEPGCYIADDVAVDETDTSIMHFSWTISRHVTEAVGPLTILICIKMVDKDGNEVNHWNSERNSEMTVSKGMECGDIIVNKYPDVITYLLADMGNLADLTTEDKSSLVAAINEAAASGGVQPLFVVNVTTTLSEQGGEVYTADKTAAEIETAYQKGCEIVCRMSVPIIGMGSVPIQLPLASRRGHQIFMFAINQTMWTDKSSRIVSYLVTIADDGVNVGQNNTEIYIKPASGIPKSDLADDVQTSLDKADAAISYDSQTMTDAQKQQARTNIGAADENLGCNKYNIHVTTTNGTTKDFEYYTTIGEIRQPAEAVDSSIRTAFLSLTLWPDATSISENLAKTLSKQYKILYDANYIDSPCRIIESPLESGENVLLSYHSSDNTVQVSGNWTDGYYNIIYDVANDALTYFYVENNIHAVNGAVNQLVMSAAPTEDMHIATKQYVDTAKTEAQQLGLTAATPGQIIKVKTVQDGKPTEWEAVDMDTEKIPKFTKLLTHTITEDELAASPIAFVWGTAQIPNLNDFNVFVLTIVRPDGAKIEFNKWVRLKINSKLLGNICGTETAASPQYTITANRLFGVWISGNYYDPRNIGVPVLVSPWSSSTFQSDLSDSEPVTSIGFTSYAADYGLTAGIVVEIWGAK